MFNSVQLSQQASGNCEAREMSLSFEQNIAAGGSRVQSLGLPPLVARLGPAGWAPGNYCNQLGVCLRLMFKGFHWTHRHIHPHPTTCKAPPRDHSSPCCMAAHLGSADAWAGLRSSDLVAFPKFLLDSSQAVKCRYGWDMSLCQRETDPTGMHGLRMCIKDYSIRCRIKVLSLSCGWRISPPSILPTLLA